jgi:PKD repeat protein
MKIKLFLFISIIFIRSVLDAQIVSTTTPCAFGTGNASSNPAPFNVNSFSSTGNITMNSGVYNFENFTLNIGHTLTIAGSTPVVIKCTGMATINGIVRAVGGNGSNAIAGLYAQGGISNNGGGKNGGIGSDNNGQDGTGVPPFNLGLKGKSFIEVAGSEGGGWNGPPGCSSSGVGIGGGAGGSYGTQGAPVRIGGTGLPSCGGTLLSSDIYGDANLTTVHNGTNLLGGSGGGGGTYYLNISSPRGGGGGGGGGAFAITANIIQIGSAGLLTVKGGNGGVGTTNGAGGGGGSGGTILLQYNTIVLPNTGTQSLPNSNNSTISINTNPSVNATNGIDYSGGTGAFSSGNLAGNGGEGRFFAQACGAVSALAPIINTQPTSLTACVGDNNIQFSVTATGIPAPNYQWRKNGSNISGANASTYTINPVSLADAGNYDVVVSNTAGSVTSVVVTLTVNPIPNVTINPSNPSICAGESVALTATGANSYSWSPASGLSSAVGANVTASPINTTSYTVTGTSAGCSGSANVTVNVTNVPSISINPSAPSICAGENITLSATGAGNYTWSPSQGLSATNTASVIASPTQTTVYTVSGGTGNCSSSATVTITVNPLPLLNINPANPSICAGESVQINVSGASTFTWSPSTGLSSSTGSSVTANPTSTTTYNVTGLTGLCSTTTAVTVSVGQIANLTVSPANPIVCRGASITLTAEGAQDYVWNPGNVQGSSFTASPDITTTYTLTAGSGNCQSSIEVIIQVLDLPIADFNYEQQPSSYQVNFTNNSSSSSSYFWNFGGGNSSSQENPNFVYPFDGIYPVTLIVSNGCGSDTVTKNAIVLKLNIHELMNIKGINVYPNPFSDFVNFELNENVQIHIESIEIYDISGKQLFFQQSEINQSSIQKIHLESLHSGTYIMKINSKESFLNIKLIKL